MASDFNTELSPEEQAILEKILSVSSVVRGHDMNNDKYDYDVNGFWKDGGDLIGLGHFKDKYKKPNHPTFSDQSIYSTPDMPGGQWLNNDTEFAPSSTNLSAHNGPENLESFFSKNEPNTAVLMEQIKKLLGR